MDIIFASLERWKILYVLTSYATLKIVYSYMRCAEDEKICFQTALRGNNEHGSNVLHPLSHSSRSSSGFYNTTFCISQAAQTFEFAKIVGMLKDAKITLLVGWKLHAAIVIRIPYVQHAHTSHLILLRSVWTLGSWNRSRLFNLSLFSLRFFPSCFYFCSQSI